MDEEKRPKAAIATVVSAWCAVAMLILVLIGWQSWREDFMVNLRQRLGAAIAPAPVGREEVKSRLQWLDPRANGVRVVSSMMTDEECADFLDSLRDTDSFSETDPGRGIGGGNPGSPIGGGNPGPWRSFEGGATSGGKVNRGGATSGGRVAPPNETSGGRVIADEERGGAGIAVGSEQGGAGVAMGGEQGGPRADTGSAKTEEGARVEALALRLGCFRQSELGF